MRNRLVAAALAFFGANFGIHHFYLGNQSKGIKSILFFWTGIPWLISMIDFVKFLGMSDEEFDFKYNRDKYHESILNSFGKSAMSSTQKLDVADELTKLASLMDKGLITFEEFEKRKAVLLK